MAKHTETRETKKDKKGREFLKQLQGKEAVKVSDLKDVDEATLSAALKEGQIEFGRPKHVRTQDDKGNPEIVAEKGFDWSDLSGPNKKTVHQLMEEEKETDATLALHVRATQAGNEAANETDDEEPQA